MHMVHYFEQLGYVLHEHSACMRAYVDDLPNGTILAPLAFCGNRKVRTANDLYDKI